MIVSIKRNIEIYGPNSKKPLRPTAELIKVIEGESYLTLDIRSAALANFLGISLPLGRSIGLAVLQKSRNEAMKAAELERCLAASPAAGIFSGAPQTAKRNKGRDRTSTIVVELPEVVADDSTLVAKMCKVTMQHAVDLRDCVVLHSKEDALEYVAATCKHHGLSEIGRTNTRKDLKDRPRGAVWVQQRQGFLLRSGGTSSFFPARSKYLATRQWKRQKRLTKGDETK